MKTILAIGMILSLCNLASAKMNCQKLFVVENSKIKTTLNNTSHDTFGDNDEIKLELNSSVNKLNEDKLFSDFFGFTSYKQPIESYFGYFEKEVAFNSIGVISVKEVKHEEIYGKYLNITMTDKDIAVPIATGSIEVPFFVASGGNHDDLLFSRSLKLDLSNNLGQTLNLSNDFGDKLQIVITPSIVKIVSRTTLSERYKLLRSELDDKIKELKSTDVNSMKYLNLNKEFSLNFSKASYFRNLLDEKIENSCAD